MIDAIKLLISFPIFLLLVVNPIRANLLVSTAITSQIALKEALKLVAIAHEIDPCNVGIMTSLGDVSALNKDYSTAVWAFGQAMLCAPEDGLIRYKYGASLNNLGFDGQFSFKEAVKLEPNNPLFNSTPH